MIRHIVILPYADHDGQALVKRGRCGARPPVVLLSGLLAGDPTLRPGFVDRGTDLENPIIGWVESERFKAARTVRELRFPARALAVAFEGEVLDEAIDRLARVTHRNHAGLVEIVSALLGGGDVRVSQTMRVGPDRDPTDADEYVVPRGVVLTRPQTVQLFRDVAARAGLAIFLDAEGLELEP